MKYISLDSVVAAFSNNTQNAVCCETRRFLFVIY